jgi:DNA-binding FadR family transcriptional regulator
MNAKAPNSAPRVSDAIHERLRNEILSGALAPGDALPSERELSDSLGINRHAVREALKRLQQSGLVQIAQGGATRVLDWRSTGGLDLLLDLVFAAGEEPAEDLMRSALEMRAAIGADAARRCAERAPDALRADIAAAAEAVAAATDERTRVDTFTHLWELVVEGSGNLAYRLAFNTLMTGLVRIPDALQTLAPRASDTAGLRALGAAIRDGDPASAVAAAGPILDRPLSLEEPRRATRSRRS